MKITCRFFDANIDKEIAGKILKDCGINLNNVKFVNCFDVKHCTISNRETNEDLNICLTRLPTRGFKKFLERIKNKNLEKVGMTMPVEKEISIFTNYCYQENIPIVNILMHELLHLKTITHCDNSNCLFFPKYDNYVWTFCDEHKKMYDDLIRELNEGEIKCLK